MMLYKFRTFDNLEFLLDLIMKERLFCAPHENLNDPFEGLFSTIEVTSGALFSEPLFSKPMFSEPMFSRTLFGSQSKKTFKSINDLPVLDKDVRVCSLSKNMSDIRMWSHYASGHTGCVIEIEEDVEANPLIHEVDYGSGLKKFTDKITEDTKASDILSFKTDHWAYEEEYRIITEEEFYSVSKKITGIFLGIRISDFHKNLIVQMTPNKIPVYQTEINQELVEIRSGKRIN